MSDEGIPQWAYDSKVDELRAVEAERDQFHALYLAESRKCADALAECDRLTKELKIYADRLEAKREIEAERDQWKQAAEAEAGLADEHLARALLAEEALREIAESKDANSTVKRMALASLTKPDGETCAEGYAPGMRDAHPNFCWRLLDDGRWCCIRDRGHDGGVHEAKPDGEA
jgi:hypothetical protein